MHICMHGIFGQEKIAITIGKEKIIFDSVIFSSPASSRKAAHMVGKIIFGKV